MQKFLFFIRYVFKIFVAAGIVLFVISFPVFYFCFNLQNPLDKVFFTSSADIILEMWHIESFEGGNLGRKAFLDKVFRLFQTQNLGVFISLKTMSVDEYLINIQSNKPNLISFTAECKGIENILTTLSRPDGVDNQLLDSCRYGFEYICYPYMIGRYALISKNENAKDSLCDEIIENKKSKIYPLGYTQNIDGKKALENNKLKYNLDAKIYDTQYDVYKAFLKGETTTILASQRDVHRLKNRERLGTMENLYYTYLNGYTNLTQYIGVVENKENIDFAKNFAQFLLTKESQKLIASCGMFSPYYKIYQSDYMKEWEDSITYTKLENLFEK